MSTRVLLAARNDAVREGLEALLVSLPDLGVAGVARDAAETIRSARITRPDIVLLDLAEGDACSVMDALRSAAPCARTLALADSAHQGARLRAGGADAVIVKGGPISGLAQAVRTLGQRQTRPPSASC